MLQIIGWCVAVGASCFVIGIQYGYKWGYVVACDELRDGYL